MRFLVASMGTIPGCSGGWTTTLDLLQPEHDAAYVVAQGGSGRYQLEDVPVTGPPPGLSALERVLPGRFYQPLRLLSFRRSVLSAWKRFRADLVLCLDLPTAGVVLRTGLPYALRLHTAPGLEDSAEAGEVLGQALFATCCVENPLGIPQLKHGENLSRYQWVDHRRPERVILVSTLVDVEDPGLFVEGVRRSGMEGAIVGDGPMREKVADMCRSTGGSVKLLPPVMRRELPALLEGFQVGVACLREGWINRYQMKVLQYQASGLFPVVQPWSELAMLRPDLTLTFRDADELAGRLNWLRKNWSSTLDMRRKGRRWALETYALEPIKQRFAAILSEAGLV